MTKQFIARAIVAVGAGLLGLSVQAASIMGVTGAGASFPYPAYAKWASIYHKETGVRVNYQSIGSGGGQQQIITGTVDFGASDDPMSGDSLKKENLLQFPALVGGIVPVLNVPGIKPGQLKLNGTLLADIFLGKITRWNDPALLALNPNLALPDESIIVVHRSDGSGTTFNFSHYLAQVSTDWKNTVGVGKAVKWPTGHGGKGNEGVAAYVQQLKNTIGYVEFAYATQNQLAWAQLQNRAGNFVQPSVESIYAAAQTADWLSQPGMGVVLTNVAGDAAWPISAATFILLPKRPRRPAAAYQVMAFFNWAFEHGADVARELEYIPMPDNVVSLIKKRWHDEIRNHEGEAIWPLSSTVAPSDSAHP